MAEGGGGAQNLNTMPGLVNPPPLFEKYLLGVLRGLCGAETLVSTKFCVWGVHSGVGVIVRGNQIHFKILAYFWFFYHFSDIWWH